MKRYQMPNRSKRVASRQSNLSGRNRRKNPSRQPAHTTEENRTPTSSNQREEAPAPTQPTIHQRNVAAQSKARPRELSYQYVAQELKRIGVFTTIALAGLATATIIIHQIQ